MHEEALYEKTREVFLKLNMLSLLSDFYLAGGTALALHLGHRKSVDLDFFKFDSFSPQKIYNSLQDLNPKIIQETEGTLDIIVNDVKVSFLQYPYKMLKSTIVYKSIYLASIEDIACMKITAISSRGSKKDYFDLYMILQQYSLEEIFKLFIEKFKGIDYSLNHILKSLVYFEDAEKDPEPDLLIDLNWNEVKKEIINIVLKFSKESQYSF